MKAEAVKAMMESTDLAIVRFGLVVSKHMGERAGESLERLKIGSDDDRPATEQEQAELDRIDAVLATPTIQVAEEVKQMVEDSVESFAIEAFKALPEKEREELSQLIAGRLRKPSSIESVTAEGAIAIRKVVSVLVERELEASRDVLMHRIAVLVAERWEAEVDAVVGKKLSEAVAKVKAEMSR
jgi:hypothetical protein